jgi:hypothetical protein
MLEDFGKRRNSGGVCIHTPIAGSLATKKPLVPHFSFLAFLVPLSKYFFLFFMFSYLFLYFNIFEKDNINVDIIKLINDFKISA